MLGIVAPVAGHRSTKIITLVAAVAAGVGITPAPLEAAEETVQNDSFVSGGSAVIVGDFVINEQAGVRLTSPCDGTIVAVQIGWLSEIPQDPSLESAIYISEDDGGFPRPGPVLATLEGPVLTPGFLNEFRYLDKGGTIPIDIPIASGESFYVALEFGNPTDVSNGGASVFRDVDGCQFGRNVLFAPNLGGWRNFCSFLAGDLVIRAVVDCIEGPGACCFDTGQCFDLEEEVCAEADGMFNGSGTLCADTERVVADQACCFEGAGCLDLPPSDCGMAGGFPQGAGTDCDTVTCFATGACCLPDGNCMEDLGVDECGTMGGDYQGDDSLCGVANCPQPLGGCCFPNDFCLELEEADCLLAGAEWFGMGTGCADLDENGTPDVCEDVACPEDLDDSGAVDFGDVLAILAAWGPCPGGCPEDVSGNEIVDFADILAVLAAWGACP